MNTHLKRQKKNWALLIFADIFDKITSLLLFDWNFKWRQNTFAKHVKRVRLSISFYRIKYRICFWCWKYLSQSDKQKPINRRFIVVFSDWLGHFYPKMYCLLITRKWRKISDFSPQSLFELSIRNLKEKSHKLLFAIF